MRTRFHEVAADVYAVLGSDGMPNAVCIDGRADGVVIVDSRFTPAYAEEMVASLREVSDAPVVALINTHFHCDHVFGNPAIPTDRIIAHERAVERLESLGDGYVETIRTSRPDLRDELEGVRLRLPTETIGDDGITLELADMTLEVRFAGRTAHTDHDLYLRIPERDVLLAADLVFNRIVPVMRDGALLGLRAVLEQLRGEGAGVVVPGHGEVGGPELIDRQIEYVDIVMDAAERAAAEGGDAGRACELALERLSGHLFAEQRIAQSVEQALAALGEARA